MDQSVLQCYLDYKGCLSSLKEQFEIYILKSLFAFFAECQIRSFMALSYLSVKPASC